MLKNYERLSEWLAVESAKVAERVESITPLKVVKLNALMAKALIAVVDMAERGASGIGWRSKIAGDDLGGDIRKGWRAATDAGEALARRMTPAEAPAIEIEGPDAPSP